MYTSLVSETPQDLGSGSRSGQKRGNLMKRMLGLFALSAVHLAPLLPQEHESAGPPPVLQITRETIKQGKASAHEKTEMEFVKAFRKAKYPGHYLGLDALSGSTEVWFLDPYPSFAVAQQLREQMNSEPLSSEMDAADSHDGVLRDSQRNLWAVYRPDMSYKPEKLNIGKTRFVSIGTYRVKLGHDEDFRAGGKAILEAYEKANFDATLLCYQVVEGAPVGTYLFFSTMESMKYLDEMAARQKAVVEAMGGDNYRQIMKGAGDTFLSIETNVFAVNPRMSYVSKATEEADPEFWRPKAAAKPATEKPKQKTDK